MILAIAEHVAGNHTFPGRAGLNSCGSETKNSDPVSDLEARIRASGSVTKSHSCWWGWGWEGWVYCYILVACR
jgi:hypothetical protein